MKKVSGEWKFLILFTTAVMGLIAVTSLLAPAKQDNDPTPSTWNDGRYGAKAAWLLLGELGYREARWEKPEAELAGVDAAHSTLILAAPSPSIAVLGEKQRREPFENFLRRGGRIVATGDVAPLLLPDMKVKAANRPIGQLYARCTTTPEGPGPLARAGAVDMLAPDRFAREDPGVRVADRCGKDAAVVSYAVGRGEVIWWASASPLTNDGLHQDGNLRLLLASVGGRERTVYFDEYLHGMSDSAWGTVHGTPLMGMIAQACCIGALLLFSFSRGSGPKRALAQPPRTSPLEFVESMGALYARGQASGVAISAAERRLAEFLSHEGGLPRELFRKGTAAVADAAAARFGMEAAALAADLEAARKAEYDPPGDGPALDLVRRLEEHRIRFEQKLRHPQR